MHSQGEEGRESHFQSLNPVARAAQAGDERRGRFPGASPLPDSPLGLPGFSPAPGRSEHVSPSRGGSLGRRGRGSRRLPRGQGGGRSRPGTSVGPGRYSPLNAQSGSDGRAGSKCRARSPALRCSRGRRLRAPPPASPGATGGWAEQGRGGGRQARAQRGHGRRGGAESVPAAPPLPALAT